MYKRQALAPIAQGDWINEHMLELPTPPDLDSMRFSTNLVTDLPEPPVATWEGYENPGGGPAGTRNILGISTTVQCVTGVLNVAVERMRRELLPKYPNVDDIVPINHAYGCGVAINAPEAKVPIRALRNLSKHPNFGGQLMVVGLGCEKFTVEMPVSYTHLDVYKRQGLDGVWWALTISSILKGIVFFIYYQRIMRRLEE